MTFDEAHRILSNGLVNAPSEHEWCMAFEMAIKALEQEPSCEDTIRREDALQALCKAVHKNDDTIPCPNQRESCLWSKTKVQDYAREIYKLPPVTPQPKTIQEKQAESEKYDKAFDDGYENGYAQARFDYEQESKTGHWIYKIYGGFHEQGDWYCSHCNYQFNYGNGHAKHCPECGYEMSEAPTEEVMSEYDKRRCNYPNDI